jgi:hypothetical protein
MHQWLRPLLGADVALLRRVDTVCGSVMLLDRTWLISQIFGSPLTVMSGRSSPSPMSMSTPAAMGWPTLKRLTFNAPLPRSLEDVSGDQLAAGWRRTALQRAHQSPRRSAVSHHRPRRRLPVNDSGQIVRETEQRSPAAVARRSASHTIECDPRALVTEHSGDRLVADSNDAR